MAANDRQVGGSHYQGQKLQHWDIVEMFKLDYFQAQILRYVMRWNKKDGLRDLQKAAHFLEKYQELNKDFKIGKSPEVVYTGNEQLPVGWTIEGYLIGLGLPHQVYKCAVCRKEFQCENINQALHEHSLTGCAGAHGAGYFAALSDASKIGSDASKQADLGGGAAPTGSYTNQG